MASAAAIVISAGQGGAGGRMKVATTCVLRTTGNVRTMARLDRLGGLPGTIEGKVMFSTNLAETGNLAVFAGSIARSRAASLCSSSLIGWGASLPVLSSKRHTFELMAC